MAALQNGWYRTWAENGYKNSRGEDIQYVEEWKLFVKLLGNSTITDVVSDRHANLSWMEFECKGDTHV